MMMAALAALSEALTGSEPPFLSPLFHRFAHHFIRLHPFRPPSAWLAMHMRAPMDSAPPNGSRLFWRVLLLRGEHTSY
jgi:hypothetical protein